MSGVLPLALLGCRRDRVAWAWRMAAGALLGLPVVARVSNELRARRREQLRLLYSHPIGGIS